MAVALANDRSRNEDYNIWNGPQATQQEKAQSEQSSTSFEHAPRNAHHHLQKQQTQPQQQQHPSARDLASSIESAVKTARSSRGPRTYRRLDRDVQEHVSELMRQANTRWWAGLHGKNLPPPRLHPAILRTISEWFQLVDDDSSGTLEHHELMAALQVSSSDEECGPVSTVGAQPLTERAPLRPPNQAKAAQIPADARSIDEMIRLMDGNRDGRIGWGEFESFMMQVRGWSNFGFGGVYWVANPVGFVGSPTSSCIQACCRVTDSLT